MFVNTRMAEAVNTRYQGRGGGSVDGITGSAVSYRDEAGSGPGRMRWKPVPKAMGGHERSPLGRDSRGSAALKVGVAARSSCWALSHNLAKADAVDPS